MAEALGARRVQPEETDMVSLADYDLIGFGPGR